MRYEGVRDFGKAWACPVCKRGNVAVLGILCVGPNRIVLDWDDQGKLQGGHEEKGEGEGLLLYDLACGHRVFSEDIPDSAKPKFARWYPEESSDE